MTNDDAVMGIEANWVVSRTMTIGQYSPAVRCYAAEIVFRSIRRWPELSYAEDGPNLAGWRSYYRIGA